MLFIKKRVITTVLAVCLLVVSVGLFSSCSRAPKVDDIYDRVVELIEASYPLNTVFYGAGLPVYQTDSQYADFTHMYYNFTYKGQYEIVSDYSRYHSVEDIKEAAAKVYSTAYLEDVLYPAAFDGYMINDGAGGAYAASRYLEEGGYFYQSTNDSDYLTGMRIYDYSTMKIAKPSKATACYVEMDSWLDHQPDVVTTVRLRLVLQDDGMWYLDSFTG